MKRILQGIDTISEWSGQILSWLIIAMISILLFEITLRYVFNSPTNWAHETTQQMFAAYSVLSGAYVLVHFQHARVDFIYMRFPPRGRAILDLITSLLFFLFIIVLLIKGVEQALVSLRIKEVGHSFWAPPMYPIRITLPVAAFLIALQGLAHFIRSLSMAITGRELT